MKTIDELDETFSEELWKLRERYREALKELIKDNGMDKGVIRMSDGKEGVLSVEQEYCKVLGYEIRFYPITKAGKVSQRASGWVWSLAGFKPKEG